MQQKVYVAQSVILLGNVPVRCQNASVCPMDSHRPECENAVALNEEWLVGGISIISFVEGLPIVIPSLIF